jgi:hypothetical protein
MIGIHALQKRLFDVSNNQYPGMPLAKKVFKKYTIFLL